MVRVGGGWEPLEEFLRKHDPCRGIYIPQQASNSISIVVEYDVRMDLGAHLNTQERSCSPGYIPHAF